MTCLPGMYTLLTMKPKDAVAAYIRKLAKAGGKARKKALSAKRRKQIAKRAANARWRGSK